MLLLNNSVLWISVVYKLILIPSATLRKQGKELTLTQATSITNMRNIGNQPINNYK
jgi:hypothetical protein